jgi:hypothetical protein
MHRPFLPIVASTYRGCRVCIFRPSPRFIAERDRIINRRTFCAQIQTMTPMTTVALNNTGRQFSTDGGINGKLGKASIESAKATTQWKRSHYRKIVDKFHQPQPTSPTTKNITQQQEPLIIDNYEDVQPMWKGMESRVTKRVSLTLDQRGGVSGRRNVRKSDEDMWLESGLYDNDKADK